MHYSDTFSPIAKMTFVQLFISLAAIHGWDLHQLDIKNVFLHGDLPNEVYMEQLMSALNTHLLLASVFHFHPYFILFIQFLWLDS